MLTPEQRLQLQQASESCDGDPYKVLALGKWVPQLIADLDAKDKLIAELSARVAAQSELLSRKAEGSLFDRVVEALRKAPMIEDLVHRLAKGLHEALPRPQLHEPSAISKARLMSMDYPITCDGIMASINAALREVDAAKGATT